MESKIFKFFSFQWNRHCPKSTRNLWQFNLLPNNIAYLHLLLAAYFVKKEIIFAISKPTDLNYLKQGGKPN